MPRLRNETGRQAWSPALVLFHFYRWRERLRDGFRQLQAGEPVTAPPEAIDELNDRELPEGAGVPLHEAARHSDAVFRELIDVVSALGDRPFRWYIVRTTGEAVLRNSYTHPRIHLAKHFIERGDRPAGVRTTEETAAALRNINASGVVLGPAIYNVACMRVAEGRRDEALTLLEEAIPMRDDLPAVAAKDPDLIALRGDPRFEALI